MALLRISFIYLRDILLNIPGIIDENGNYIVRYKYSAYGKVTKDIESNLSNDSTFVANFNPLIYKGYYYDIETGFYYLESRYYDPEIGRFISPDSVDYLDPTSINGLNLYAYCVNDPVNYVDPSGHAPKWWQSILIGVGVIAVAALAAAAIVYTGGGAAAFFATAGKAALSGLEIAVVAGGIAGLVRAGKTAIEGGDIVDVGKSAVLGFSDGFLVGSIYAASLMLLGAASYRISGAFNNGYGWSHGIFEGGYQTPNTPGITLLAINGGVNGGRAFTLDLDIYHSWHFHYKLGEFVENKFLKRALGKIKRHRWHLHQF